MKNKILIFLILSFLGCTKNENLGPLKKTIDLNTIKVSEIDGGYYKYKFYYKDELLSSIVRYNNFIPFEFHSRNRIIDSIYYYYSEGALDSFGRYEEAYLPYDPLFPNRPVIQSSSARFKFIKDGQNRIIKVMRTNPSPAESIPGICFYDSTDRIINYQIGGNNNKIKYDQFNNVIQICDTFGCYKYEAYDNSPNPFKAINSQLKYPFFEQFYCFSNNNISLYTNRYKRKLIRNYKYDLMGRVTEIIEIIDVNYVNNKIKIDYY